MKEKIFIFIIGLLVGAILTTGVFFAYTLLVKSTVSANTQVEQMNNGGQPPKMPDGETPPEMPNGDKPEMNGDTSQDKSTEDSTDQSDKSSNSSKEKSHSKEKKSTNDTSENN